MKKILIFALSISLTITALAQRGHGFGYAYTAPRVIVSTGLYSPFYPLYSPYGIYNRPYINNINRLPSYKLDQIIKDIKNDYNNRIWNVKHASKLKGKLKRHEIKLLKQEREKAIADAKINYYKQRR